MEKASSSSLNTHDEVDQKAIGNLLNKLTIRSAFELLDVNISISLPCIYLSHALFVCDIKNFLLCIRLA